MEDSKNLKKVRELLIEFEKLERELHHEFTFNLITARSYKTDDILRQMSAVNTEIKILLGEKTEA